MFAVSLNFIAVALPGLSVPAVVDDRPHQSVSPRHTHTHDPTDREAKRIFETS